MIILSAYFLILDRADGERIFIQATIERTQTMLLLCLGTLSFGVWGGFDFGRFVQSKLMGIDRRERLKQSVDLIEQEYNCKVAATVDEARKLVEAGYEYTTSFEEHKLFRKRK